MDGLSLLRDITAYMKYCRVKEDGTKETLQEAFFRVMYSYKNKLKEVLALTKASSLQHEDIWGLAEQSFLLVQKKQILPSMRALQFAGEALEKQPQRMFNCLYKEVRDIKSVVDIFYMLLCGCGVGYSVRAKHISSFPKYSPNLRGEKLHFRIEDTIEGWCDALEALLKYLFLSAPFPVFDYGHIRRAGTPLLTSGGISPGPEPLKIAFSKVLALFENKPVNTPVTSLEISDVICIISDCVVSGGSRRSALIGLFDADDMLMFTSKHGQWHKHYSYRSRANISFVVHKEQIIEERQKIKELIYQAVVNGFGEPGIVVTNDIEQNYGTNPCAEISLQNGGACNLCEINATSITSSEQFLQCCISAAFLGTLQSTFTNFSYVSNEWRERCEQERLLGVSITGIHSSPFFMNLYYRSPSVLADLLQRGARVIQNVNRYISEIFKIPPAIRLTCIKPAGSTSCILGCSSGIHPVYAPYFIRRVRVLKKSQLYAVLKQNLPDFVEDDITNPFNAVVSIPIVMFSPTNKYTKDFDFMAQLQIAHFMQKNWVLPGHIKGADSHNVSLTVHYKEGEKETFIEAIVSHLVEKDSLRSISFFPYDETKYPQAPFEEIDIKKYNFLITKWNKEFSIFNTHSVDAIDLSPSCGGKDCRFSVDNQSL